ncbi:MAG TPA: DUF427 domain-containing protein [Mycobacteriales bacterium]|nr:DUF427 domain-containing protein [Mycobacteriales bacterium]
MTQPTGGFRDRFDYRVELLARRNSCVARTDSGQLLARTERPLVVDEQDHGLVIYFPETDVDLTALVAIDLVTTCPYKGQATHWRLTGGTDPVAWTYRQPHPEVARLAGYIAFYQDRVRVEIGAVGGGR